MGASSADVVAGAFGDSGGVSGETSTPAAPAVPATASTAVAADAPAGETSPPAAPAVPAAASTADGSDDTPRHLIANPGSDVRLAPGQMLVVMGSKDQLDRVSQLLGNALVGVEHMAG